MPPSPKKYKSTINGVNMWAQSELEHIGRIASVEDPDLQYAYALSTVNGMLHLRNAIYELMEDDAYLNKKNDLSTLYNQVNKALQHLVIEYKVERQTIQQFNTRAVLGNIGNINWNNTGDPTVNLPTPIENRMSQNTLRANFLSPVAKPPANKIQYTKPDLNAYADIYNSPATPTNKVKSDGGKITRKNRSKRRA